jgi:hypothetical protein
MTLANPLQEPNATPVCAKESCAATPRACRPRLLAAVIRSNATLAFAAENGSIVRRTCGAPGENRRT